MTENTINQRLKFLMDALDMKAGAFSRALGISETNIRNYTDRTSKPGFEALEKIASTFKQVNLAWLIAGEGEPFLTAETETGITQTGNFNQAGNSNIQKVKGSKNNVQTNNGDHATITNNVKLDNCQRDLEASRKEVALLTSQLADKERTIQILMKQNS